MTEPTDKQDPAPKKTPILRRLRELFSTNTKAVAEPEKEIRFTRSAQATFFLILTVLCIVLCISSLFCIYVNWGPWHYDFKENWWMSLLALIPALIFFRIAVHCIRHAYIILTPMGVEIFPLIKPQKNLQVIFWSDIDHVEIDRSLLKIHYNAEETAGIILSLKPISKSNYPLLDKAILGRISRNN